MGKIKAVLVTLLLTLIVLALAVVWTFIENKVKILIGGYGTIAWAAGLISVTIIMYFLMLILDRLGIIELRPPDSEDPLLNDAEWREGIWHNPLNKDEAKNH